jgi:hypothetical protein
VNVIFYGDLAYRVSTIFNAASSAARQFLDLLFILDIGYVDLQSIPKNGSHSGKRTIFSTLR